ncbi:hypothetical protein COT75_02835 [Candidatus Beckwithbacteria bacterium CG10_big_fil_rev_8_21_14_0_10_34_10]|uniref:Glycosyltransferase RgtA/B/C/D-like domain-containing protein n=1 Tax=Candidatus Beckwithbacteria bacterium CG10_big_fil_rev_8_21_14_0_10_34_10 TaxID=1974495 RepID=A0A2H0W927_9BACT|nr:MAG: hypothetical protein COT75_02835 [Candidatus Beckwithbacteria bacterium CG10_big_fil_rev_8_21_14_0_10_34_10]
MKKSEIKEIIFLISIFITAFFLRTYKIDNPVADWHSWRQADTAAVARNFATEDFNIFYPRSQIEDLDNPNRYFLNEFPLYNAVVALFYQSFGVQEKLARLVSVFVSSLTVVFLYLLAKQYSSKLIAFLSALFYAVLPYNIYYGRVIMPDPTFIFFSVLSLYLITLWLNKEKRSLALVSGFSLALAMLTKPYAIFLGIPIAYLVFKKWGIKSFKKLDVYLLALIGLIPLGLWRYHINLHPEGMFGSKWLINSTNIRFKGAFFRWIIFDRLNRLILATGGFVLFFQGLVSKRDNKEGLFYLTWLLSAAAYISYFAMGNVTHDYYQMPIVPVACIFMAKGFDVLWQKAKDGFSTLFNRGIAISLVLIMLAFGWYEVRGFFNINRWEIVEAGQAVDQLTPQESKIIAPYDWDPAFLYQTNRNGWPVLRNKDELQEYILRGATYYVSVDFNDQTNTLKNACSVLKETEKFIIIDLQECDFAKIK